MKLNVLNRVSDMRLFEGVVLMLYMVIEDMEMLWSCFKMIKCTRGPPACKGVSFRFINFENIGP